MKKTDIEIENKVICEYVNNGLSFKQIGDKLGINSVTAFNIIKRNGICSRTKGGIYSLPIDEIKRMYLDGIPVVEISKKFNVNCKTIYNYLEKNEIYRNYIYHNRTLNRRYFQNIDSYDKAYFLGFMITDGCVTEDNSVSLTLKMDDYEILETFRQKISNENKLYYNYDRNEVSFRFKSKETQNDLSKYGVVYRKTFTTFLPLLPNPFLMSHMLRGIFDGDGWISEKSHNIGLCSASYIFIKYVRDYLHLLLGVYSVNITVSTNNRLTPLYQIQWSSLKDIFIIGSYIYSGKRDCYLKRKFNNWKNICNKIIPS